MIGKPCSSADQPLVTLQARYGTMTFLSGDQVIGRSLGVYGEWAQNEIALLCTFLEEGSVAVDAGANIGTHTLAFARHVGVTGRVFAFEPQPDLYQLLRQNLQDNSVTCVEARCAALSDCREVLYIPCRTATTGANPGATQLLQAPLKDQDAIPVDASPLDDLHLERCNLIKADVEGMELRILRGAESTLGRCMPVLYLECNTISHAVSIFEFLRDKSYRVYLHKAPAFNPGNFFGSEEKIFGAACETSILAIPLQKGAEYVRLSADIHIVPIGSIDDLAFAFAETQLIFDLRQALAHAEQIAFEKQAEILRHDHALAEAQQLVAQRDREIDQLRQALAHVEEIAVERQAEILRHDQALAEAQRLAAQRDREIDQLRQALAQADEIGIERQAEILQYGETLAAMENSVAWRVLKPFRSFGAVLRARRK